MSTDSKTTADWQVQTIRAFVIKEKQDRYVEKISSAKKRPDFVRNLAHFADFDPRFIVKIVPSSQHPPNIESILRAKGAPATCLAISEVASIDSQQVSLADALKQVVDYQMGTILCCIPGRLAYFENEDARFIQEREG